MDLTDDMRRLLRAAYKVAPKGETFILEDLPLRGFDETRRRDSAFKLEKEPLRYITRANSSASDGSLGTVRVPDPRGTPYQFTKLGRPVARQIVIDARRKRREKRRMSTYNLHDHQRDTLRRMVEIARANNDTSFHYIESRAGTVAIFVQAQAEVPVNSSDLHAFEAENLVILRGGAGGSLSGGSLLRSAYDAIDNNFERPAAATTFGTVQNIYAPVGAITTGSGGISIATQNIGILPGEVGALIASMRDGLGELPQDERAGAAELLDELEEEVRQKVPKQSKIKAYLLGLAAAAPTAVEFAGKIAEVAKAYGIDPTKLFHS